MTGQHHHAVVWIDHREARVFHLGLTGVGHQVLHPEHPTKHIRHKANCIGSGHAVADHEYLQAVTESIADAGAILITGPANAKTELIKHIDLSAPRLKKVIVGVETVDHPSDPQLVAFAKKVFEAQTGCGRRGSRSRLHA